MATKNKKICGGLCQVPRDAQVCSAQKSGFACTLPPGHEGKHIACAGAKHGVHVWEASPKARPRAIPYLAIRNGNVVVFEDDTSAGTVISTVKELHEILCRYAYRALCSSSIDFPEEFNATPAALKICKALNASESRS